MVAIEGSDCRLVLLVSIARVRAAGWAPALLLAGWIVFAATQEPRMLRGYGIHLLGEAAWVGGLLYWLTLLIAEPRVPRRLAWASNVLLLVIVAALQGGFALLLDWLRGPVDLGAHGTWLVMFVLAWTPLSLTFRERAFDAASRHRVLGIAVVAVVLAVGCAHAVVLRSMGFTATNLVSCACALVGGLVWASRPRLAVSS
jgi:hypothetical protein